VKTIKYKHSQIKRCVKYAMKMNISTNVPLV
jgi:hypothetical protein